MDRKEGKNEKIFMHIAMPDADINNDANGYRSGVCGAC